MKNQTGKLNLFRDNYLFGTEIRLVVHNMLLSHPSKMHKVLYFNNTCPIEGHTKKLHIPKETGTYLLSARFNLGKCDPFYELIGCAVLKLVLDRSSLMLLLVRSYIP